MSEDRPAPRRPPPADLTATRHRPHQERVFLGLVLAAAIVVALAGWGLGRYQGATNATAMTEELKILAARHVELLAERERLERELSDFRVGQLVGAGFDEQIRTTLAEQASRIAALEDEVRFYRNLMASDEDGVQIARLELVERIGGRGVRFRLLLVQSADRREEISGHVQLAVVGEQAGAPAVIEFNGDGNSGHPLPFRFRYFQDLVGEIELPEGFRPEGVQVIARGAGPDGFRLERTFSWHIQEA